MNKYYLRSIREDGFGECVVPEMEEPIFKRDAAIATQQNLEWHSYLSSLPVSALAHPEIAKKIGWVENVGEVKEFLNAANEWKEMKPYYAFGEKQQTRILLVEKKQEEKSDGNKPEWVPKKHYNKLLKALSHLCHLKKWKDEHGKDSHYEQFQPEAWAYAFDVLESLNEINPTPPVSGEPGGLQDETFLHYFREGYKYHRSFSEKVPYDEASEITVKKGFEQTRKQ